MYCVELKSSSKFFFLAEIEYNMIIYKINTYVSSILSIYFQEIDRIAHEHVQIFRI